MLAPLDPHTQIQSNDDGRGLSGTSVKFQVSDPRFRTNDLRCPASPAKQLYGACLPSSLRALLSKEKQSRCEGLFIWRRTELSDDTYPIVG